MRYSCASLGFGRVLSRPRSQAKSLREIHRTPPEDSGDTFFMGRSFACLEPDANELMASAPVQRMQMKIYSRRTIAVAINIEIQSAR